jgi:hypothetical protein
MSSPFMKSVIVCPTCGALTDETEESILNTASIPLEGSVNDSRVMLAPCDQNSNIHCVCFSCGNPFMAVVNNGAIVGVEKDTTRPALKKKLDLVMLEPTDKPVYFIVSSLETLNHVDSPDGVNAERAFFYENGSALNWNSDILQLVHDGKSVPTGLFTFVARAEGDDREDKDVGEFDMLEKRFPQMFQAYTPTKKRVQVQERTSPYLEPPEQWQVQLKFEPDNALLMAVACPGCSTIGERKIVPEIEGGIASYFTEAEMHCNHCNGDFLFTEGSHSLNAEGNKILHVLKK